MKKHNNQSSVAAVAATEADKNNKDGSASGKDKAGTGAAGVKEVNLEHMPQFIKNAPWYMN